MGVNPEPEPETESEPEPETEPEPVIPDKAVSKYLSIEVSKYRGETYEKS